MISSSIDDDTKLDDDCLAVIDKQDAGDQVKEKKKGAAESPKSPRDLLGFEKCKEGIRLYR